MISTEDIARYLPKYLSDDTQAKLFADLSSFPNNIDQRFYTTIPEGDNVIFQGDGLRELLVINLPDERIQPVPCMILSNTCDIDPSNKHMLDANIIYAPIVALHKYRSLLLRDGIYTQESIESHINTIRKQRVTSIFYLPPFAQITEESIVLLDKINNCMNTYVPRDCIKTSRLFSLSQYGHYLFLFKLSIHFTRIQEQVDRGY